MEHYFVRNNTDKTRTVPGRKSSRMDPGAEAGPYQEQQIDMRTCKGSPNFSLRSVEVTELTKKEILREVLPGLPTPTAVESIKKPPVKAVVVSSMAPEPAEPQKEETVVAKSEPKSKTATPKPKGKGRGRKKATNKPAQ